MQRIKKTLTLPWIHFLYWCWWYKHGCSQHVFMKPLRMTSFPYIQHSIKITQLFLRTEGQRCIAIYPRMYILYITFMYIFFQFENSLSIIWTECFQPVKNLNLTAILLEMFEQNQKFDTSQFWLLTYRRFHKLTVTSCRVHHESVKEGHPKSVVIHLVYI